MPYSELNFIIKLRHITTYLESGVTAARVEISKFLTLLTRSFFFKIKTPTQSFRLKPTISYLCHRILTTEKCCHIWKSTSKHFFQGRDVNLCTQDVYISAKLSVVLRLLPISVGNSEFSGKEREPSNKGLSE